MKLTLRAFFLCVSLACGGQAGAATLPDSCGADNFKFGVKTEKNQAALAGPAEGKAQIVFIETESQMTGAFMYATVRCGILRLGR